MWYHADQCFRTAFPQSVEVSYGLRDVPQGTLLDFGGGPGTSALFFYELGWKIAIADISTSFQECAQWCLNLHGVPADFDNTSKVRLTPNAFNVITAFDVIVHITDIPTALDEMGQSLQFAICEPMGSAVTPRSTANSTSTRRSHGHRS